MAKKIIIRSVAVQVSRIISRTTSTKVEFSQVRKDLRLDVFTRMGSVCLKNLLSFFLFFFFGCQYFDTVHRAADEQSTSALSAML